MHFIATHSKRDGRHCVEFDAPSYEDAQMVCRKKLWHLEGELERVVQIPRMLSPLVEWFLRNFGKWL